MRNTRNETYEVVSGTEPEPEESHEPRTVRVTRKGPVQMMSEIEDGVMVAWSTCKGCSKHVADCRCPSGPVEPHYIAKWREQRFATSLKRRLPKQGHKTVLGDALTYHDLATLAKATLTSTPDTSILDLAKALETADISEARKQLRQTMGGTTAAAVDAGLNDALQAVNANTEETSS